MHGWRPPDVQKCSVHDSWFGDAMGLPATPVARGVHAEAPLREQGVPHFLAARARQPRVQAGPAPSATVRVCPRPAQCKWWLRAGPPHELEIVSPFRTVRVWVLRAQGRCSVRCSSRAGGCAARGRPKRAGKDAPRLAFSPHLVTLNFWVAP